MLAGPLRLALTALVLAILLGGCYGSADPSVRPGGSRDVLAALTRHGVIVSEIAVGEPACDDPGLVGNALHLTAATGGDPASHDVYIYLFRPRSWEGSAGAVDACQAEYAATLAEDEAVRRLDVPTYRAFGAGWSDEMREAIEAALEEASTMGR